MGKIVQGINGPFFGKVGSVVGYMWKGIPVMRAIPKKRTKPFSEKELNQQARFRIMNACLCNLKDHLNITFGHLAVGMAGYSKAFSYNVKNAIIGALPDMSVNYPLLLLSRGDVPSVEKIEFSSPLENVFQFNWTDNTGVGKALSTDRVFVALFNQKLGQWSSLLNCAMRSDGSCRVEINNGWKSTEQIHAWIGFLARDGKDASDSVYGGVLQMTAK